MKNKLTLISLLLVVLLMLPSVSSFFPVTHKLISKSAMEPPIDSGLYKACAKYPKLCYAGNVLTDISVIFYYTERQKYTATHSPNFCRSLIENVANTPGDSEKLQACSLGCDHQAQDIPSHNKMVVYAVTHSGIVNNLIHTFAEQKLDNWVVANYPNIKDEAMADLNDYETCVPLFKKALMGDPTYSDLTEAELDGYFETFIREIQQSDTGYDSSFKGAGFFTTLKSVPFVILGIYLLFMFGFLLLSILLIFKIIKGDRRIRIWIGLIIFIPILLLLAYVFIGSLQGKAFAYFVNVIRPISNLVPIGGNEAYITEGISNTRAFFSQGEQWLSNTEASGFTALGEADRTVKLMDYVILFVLAGILIWFIWLIFKKNKIKARETFAQL